MIQAYDKLGMEQLSSDAKRVYALNEKKGYFNAVKLEPLDDKPIVRQIWDYIGLDEN